MDQIKEYLSQTIQNISEAMSSGMRQMFLNIDEAVYNVFAKIFDLFFDVSKITFLEGEFYQVVFRRVFIILSIFMLFKLTISFISYVISPDAATDPKNPKNMGKLIGRVIVTILFLIILVPIGHETSFAKQDVDNYYDGTNYQSEDNPTMEENIQNLGILFGTLQSIQNAVLDPSNNVLGKLILGDSVTDVVKTNNQSNTAIASTSNTIAMTTFHAFYYIDESSLDGEYYCKNNGGQTDVELDYVFPDWATIQKAALVKCGNGSGGYLVKYSMFISTLVGIVICVLTFMFTFDVALRAIKLGILRLLAPIPALSYIDPKSAQDGMFANYTKTLLSTYVDIFIRVGLIYFIILLLSNVASPDTAIINYRGAGGFAKVIVIISLLFFATSAPQFIMQALGIKSAGKGLGFGAGLLGGALGGAIAGGAAGGLGGALSGILGGAKTGSSNYNQAAGGQKPNMSAWQAARNRGAQLGAGDPNAKPEDAFMSLKNRMQNRGINGNSVAAAKQNMYDWQSRGRTAQDDFHNNTANAYGVRASDGKSWSSIAEGHKNAVIGAQSKVTSLQQKRDRYLEAYQSAMESGDRRKIDLAKSSLDSLEGRLSTAEADLAAAQHAQQTDYAEYSDYIAIETGKAESKYKQGDQLLNNTSVSYRRRSAKDVRGKYK